MNINHSVPYAALCKTFENIENTTKRIKIQEYLTKLLVAIIKLSPDNLLETIYLFLNIVDIIYIDIIVYLF